jgi:hypothetical protein
MGGVKANEREQDWPKQAQTWMTGPGLHLSIQVVTLEYYTSTNVHKPVAENSELTSKLKAIEGKIAEMKAEHDSQLGKLTDNLWLALKTSAATKGWSTALQLGVF